MNGPKLSILPILALLLVPGLCRAETVQYSNDSGSLFTLTFPDGWYIDQDYEAEAKAAGADQNGDPAIRILEAMPGDGSKLWFGIWSVPNATTLDKGIEYVASLDGYLFTEVQASEPKATQLGGMEAKTLYGTALREGEEVEFAVALFEPRDEVIVVALYVGRPQTWKAHQSDLQALVDSIAPVGD